MALKEEESGGTVPLRFPVRPARTPGCGRSGSALTRFRQCSAERRDALRHSDNQEAAIGVDMTLRMAMQIGKSIECSRAAAMEETGAAEMNYPRFTNNPIAERPRIGVTGLRDAGRRQSSDESRSTAVARVDFWRCIGRRRADRGQGKN
ncbi:hypothetical protein [Burkholderia sp. Se-20378]|uniref:hypothetical protein n=1 Tax=Burkholderia sp. Se-20378 TaxID=2703899 RepID=UPI00197D9318|nr:hypothetical protein [Burkholderia sp. Se-20378]MBN3773500.1 hypothetical protein [Burkholderia sp. Se-20378]